MTTNRRTFLKLSAMAGGSVGLGLVPGVSALAESAGLLGRAPKPLKYSDSRRHRLHRTVSGEVRPQSRPQSDRVQSRAHASGRIAKGSRAVNRRSQWPARCAQRSKVGRLH